MVSLTPLEFEFDKDLRHILEKERDLNLCSRRFREMLDRYCGVETAHRLLKTNPEPMFEYLRSKSKLDLTMEFYVVMEKYRSLFSDGEREAAQWRLDHGA